jgi:AraC-like DNA-binding protein
VAAREPRLAFVGEISQRVGAFTMLPALIRELGADPVATLASAGLSAGALADRENRVSHASVGHVLSEAVDRTRCEHFGLLAGRMWHLSDLGFVGDVMRNSRTVGEALKQLVACQHANDESAALYAREFANVVDLGFAFPGSAVPGLPQFCDAYLAAGFNFLRDLAGPTWRPTQVFLPHAAPRDPTPYRQYFKVQPHFNAEICALRFPSDWMRRSLRGGDPQRMRVARAKAMAAAQPKFVDQVARSLRILLVDGKSSGDDVASMMSMHRRTLNRRLKNEGTTFQITLDRIRCEAACQLLGGSDIPLDDVAAALCYAGVSPFMRSFRRWTGTTPGRWRNAMEAARSGATNGPSSDSRGPAMLSAARLSAEKTRDHGSTRGRKNVREGNRSQAT